MIAKAKEEAAMKALQAVLIRGRTMSQANYDTLMATGKLPATSETFISPSLEYAQQYNVVTVQFNMQAGTQDDSSHDPSELANWLTAYRLPSSSW